jgi:hypothetical protein
VKTTFPQKAWISAVNLARSPRATCKARPLQTRAQPGLLGARRRRRSSRLLWSGQLEERMERDARGIDLVVGREGQPDAAHPLGHLSSRCADRQRPARGRADPLAKSVR